MCAFGTPRKIGKNFDMRPDAINFSIRGLSVNLNDGKGITLSSSSSQK